MLASASPSCVLVRESVLSACIPAYMTDVYQQLFIRIYTALLLYWPTGWLWWPALLLCFTNDVQHIIFFLVISYDLMISAGPNMRLR